VQERLLAPHVLHFSAQQLFWECREFDAAEKYLAGLPPILKWAATFKSIDLTLDRAHMQKMSRREWNKSYNFNMLWNKIVGAYSSARLTKAEDKPIALAGIAKMLQSISNDEYVAGLWQEYFAS
jgi:hypothetical protein